MTDSPSEQPVNQILGDWPIDWLRQTSPYINTHRGKTFVVWFPGDLINSAEFTPLIHDLTLLSHLGIKLVVVHGMRAQIDTELSHRNIAPQFGDPSNALLSGNGSENIDPNPSSSAHTTPPQMRVTTTETLPAVTNAVATVRSKLESAFSKGLPNSPMSGAQITLVSGNFIVAKPYGVRNGIDYEHTGEIRKIRAQKITTLLNAEMVALLSPIGYSTTGEMFNLLSEDVAVQAAIALDADKLIFLHKDASAIDATVREIAASDSRQSAELMAKDLDTNQLQSLCAVIDRSLHACRNGVKRCHIVDANQNDALLRELFTRDGSGLLIDSGNFDNIRPADTNSVSGIMQLIKPLMDDGTLVKRSKQDLERDIQHFYVIEREGSIICCASLKNYEDFAEFGCLAVNPDFRASGKASDIFEYLKKIAQKNHKKKLFAFSTRSGDWFLAQGFKQDNPATLPKTFPAATQIESKRGSKLYTLDLTIN